MEWATEALRVLKPGGHLLAFGGTRTYHRLACAVEDAGFEIRDSVIWLYGSGFPKSLDVSKAIDKRPGARSHDAFKRHLAERREAKGLSRADVSEAVVGSRSGACWNWEHHQFPEAKWWPKLAEVLDLDPTWEAVIAEAERQRIGTNPNIERARRSGGEIAFGAGSLDDAITAPATPEAQKWNGFGTSLKPAHEPVVVARKPLIGTVAENVQAHGTGALNIDGCRIGITDGATLARDNKPGDNGWKNSSGGPNRAALEGEPAGRWPANVTLSHLPECEAVGTRKVKSQAPIYRNDSEGQSPGWGSVNDRGAGTQIGHADEDGTETVIAYNCAPGCPVAELDRQSGERMHGAGAARDAIREADEPGMFGLAGGDGHRYGDTGGASRFFYTAKASRAERNAGLDGFEEQQLGGQLGQRDGKRMGRSAEEGAGVRASSGRNMHPT